MLGSINLGPLFIKIILLFSVLIFFINRLIYSKDDFLYLFEIIIVSAFLRRLELISLEL